MVKERDGFVREFVRVVASFEVSQSLWWKRWRMRLSFLFMFCCGFEVVIGEEEKSDDGFWVLWEVRGGRRERVRENMVVFWRMLKNDGWFQSQKR